jgi:hypothetical protein
MAGHLMCVRNQLLIKPEHDLEKNDEYRGAGGA